MQRISAVYLALFTVFIAFYFLLGAPASYAEWHAWMARPLVGMMWALFFVALLAHAWVGIRDVLMDYAKPTGLRLALLALLGLALIALGYWSLQVLLLARFA
jgi:succinate dehydrogenase / fumarate reductase, membrane anchor subunit